VFSIVELKTALLDYGIPGISPLHMMLLFLLLAGAPMIPYFFLYRSLRDKEARAPRAEKTSHLHGFTTRWLHLHHHAQPLHH
jgi:hypothetical protein